MRSRFSRSSQRLRGWNYRTPGLYFVTICVQNRHPILSTIESDSVILSEVGEMAENVLCSLPARFPGISIEAYVLMPNHVHSLFRLDQAGPKQAEDSSSEQLSPVALPEVVGAFKSLSTVSYIRHVRDEGWERFDDRLWQRGYWDHIVRSEEASAQVRRYIEQNPKLWSLDKENPDAVGELPIYAWLAGQHSGPTSSTDKT